MNIFLGLILGLGIVVSAEAVHSYPYSYNCKRKGARRTELVMTVLNHETVAFRGKSGRVSTVKFTEEDIWEGVKVKVYDDNYEFWHAVSKDAFAKATEVKFWYDYYAKAQICRLQI